MHIYTYTHKHIMNVKIPARALWSPILYFLGSTTQELESASFKSADNECFAIIYGNDYRFIHLSTFNTRLIN